MLTIKAQSIRQKGMIYNSINSFPGLQLVISANFVYILLIFSFLIVLLIFDVINIASKMENRRTPDLT